MSQTLALFVLAAFITIVTPGPTVRLALANGSRFGVLASLPGMAGAVMSDFVLIAAAAVGLGALYGGRPGRRLQSARRRRGAGR